jgi:pimeloyl-ACP methyl ester carboxylesterase
VGQRAPARVESDPRTERSGTFLDELQGPNPLNIAAQAISGLEIPVRLTSGSESPPIFLRVIDRLAELIPRVTCETIEGAAHVPQMTTPERFVEVTTRGLQQHATV